MKKTGENSKNVLKNAKKGGKWVKINAWVSFWNGKTIVSSGSTGKKILSASKTQLSCAMSVEKSNPKRYKNAEIMKKNSKNA